MSIQFFGQFLLEKGLITPAQLLSAIDIQKISNIPLGQLAVQCGFVDEKSVKLINLEQQRADLLFGELAVSMGYMTQCQIIKLFDIQKDKRKLFGEIIVEQGFITPVQLAQQLASHTELRQVSMFQFDNVMNLHKYSDKMVDCLDAMTKNFMRVPKIQIQLSKILEGSPVASNDMVVVSQTMFIPQSVKVGWMMEKSLMKKVACGFIGFDISDNEVVCIDALVNF